MVWLNVKLQAELPLKAKINICKNFQITYESHFSFLKFLYSFWIHNSLCSYWYWLHASSFALEKVWLWPSWSFSPNRRIMLYICYYLELKRMKLIYLITSLVFSYSLRLSIFIDWLIDWERSCLWVCAVEGQRERENSKQALGLDLMTVSSWPELKSRVGCLTDWTIQMPQWLNIHIVKCYSCFLKVFQKKILDF